MDERAIGKVLDGKQQEDLRVLLRALCTIERVLPAGYAAYNLEELVQIIYRAAGKKNFLDKNNPQVVSCNP